MNSKLKVRVLNDLGLTYKKMGRYPESLEKYSEAYRLAAKVFGKRHSNTAIIMDNFAGALSVMGRDQDALDIQLQTVIILKETGGPMSRELAITLGSVGENLIKFRRYKEALKFLKQSLSILERKGENQVAIAIALDNIAGVYRRLKRFQEAEQLYLRAQKLLALSVGEGHFEFGINVNNLAGLYRLQGRESEAKQGYSRSIEILTKALGSNHPEVVRIKKSYQQYLDEAKQ